MAEWLGSALQKLLQRFESARHLKNGPSTNVEGFFMEILEIINEGHVKAATAVLPIAIGTLDNRKSLFHLLLVY